MDDPTTPTAHVNPPQQDRSRRTLERIVRAALALLDEEGPDGLTVQAVVARAKSSVGSFYARFKGKEELLEYLEERVWEEARERWQAQLAERDWSSLSMEEVARGSARLLADAHRSRAIFLKSLDRMGAANGEGYASFRRFVLQALAGLLMEHRDRIGHESPELAVRLGLAALSGIVETGDPETGELFAEDVTVREGSRLVLAYLAGETAAGKAPEAAPAAAPESAEPVDAPESAEPATGDVDGPGEHVSDSREGERTDGPEVAASDEAEVEVSDEPDVEVAGGGEGEGDEDDDEEVDFFDVWG